MTGFAELSQETTPTAKEIAASQITYSYDNDGNIKKVTYPTTKDGICALSYVYDQNGWLTQIKGDVRSGSSKTEKTVRSYTYDAYGKVREIKDYRNLLKSTAQAVRKVYTYDSFDRVKEMKYTDLVTGKEMESYSYSYDKNSTIIQKTEINNYPSDNAKKVNETKTYTYDGLGQLTKTVTTDHKKSDQKKTVTYTYDKAGNRTKEDDGTTQTAYTYNGLDQLKTATKAKGTAVDEVRQYSYDANGNQTEIRNTKTGQTESYAYDAENRLSQVSVTSKDGKTSVTQQNRYNGDGQRIQKVEGNKTTNYYYQDGVVSYTTDAAGSQTSQNLIGTDGNIIATQRYVSDGTGYYLYNKDIQGSSTSLVKEDGSADSTYQYTDFGETTINGDDKAGNEVCYTGGIYDQSTGLYYLNARYYDPEDGRFVTEDTYRGETDEPDTQNLYAYCAGNPVNYVDPSGHSWTGFESIKKKANSILSGIIYKRAKKVMKEYNKNKKISYKSGMIKEQYTSAVSKLKYKNNTVKNSGCTVVAVYNALFKLGKKKKRNLRKLLAEFYYNDYASSGSYPESVGKYFKSHGIKYKLVKSLKGYKKDIKANSCVNVSVEGQNCGHSFFVHTYKRKNTRYFTAYNMLGKGNATVNNSRFSNFSGWLDLAGMKIISAYIIQ